MTPKEKAEWLVDKYMNIGQVKLSDYSKIYQPTAKVCALIAVENEYRSLRELLFNLRSCGVIESDKVYLYRIQQLIDEEQEVKQEIEKL